tara:strand:+ start:150 stop:770 length:621 start_codon:yes stop_codon:yes gene_type:complete
MNKILLILMLTFVATACSNTTKVTNEGTTKTGMIEEIPSWYSEKVGKKGVFNQKDKFYVYGVGTATSPDLQLAMEKAKIIAKADIADVLQGELNGKSQTYIEEVGQNEAKTVVTETNNTIINIIKNTKVQGYEQWKVEVSITPNKEYRVWMGLQYPLGEFNKLKDYVKSQAAIQLNSISKGEERFEELEEEISAVPVPKVTVGELL